MKTGDCFMIARRDIKAKKNFCFQVVRGVFTIVVVLTFFLLVVYGIRLYYTEEVAECTSDNVVSYTPLRNTPSNEFSEEDLSTMELFLNSPYIESTVDRVNIDMPKLSNMPDKAFVNLKYISVLCGEKTYFQSADEQAVFSLQATGFNADYQMFSEVQLEAFETLNNIKPLKNGRFPQSADEVLVNEVFLRQFQMQESDILNQPLSILVNNNTVFSGLTCVGILRNDYANSAQDLNQAVLWLLLNKTYLEKLPFRSEQVQFYPYQLDSFQKIEEVILQNKLENTVFYFSDEIEICLYIERIKLFTDVILCSITLFIILALSLSLYSVLFNHVQKCTGYYGMLSAIGMQIEDKLKVFYYEFCILVVLGILAAIPVGIVLYLITNYLLNTFFVSELSISVLSMFGCVAVISIFVLILTLIIATVILFRQFKLPIIEQLRIKF